MVAGAETTSFHPSFSSQAHYGAFDRSPFGDHLMHDPFVGNWHDNWSGGLLPLGSEYLLNVSDQLGPALFAQAPATAHPTTAVSSAATSVSPTSTLVGSSSGLQINLIWDASVKSSANWSAFESAFAVAAKIYTDNFTNHAVINIDVGLGEVGGSKLGAGALGESESNGYLVGEATAQNALASHDAGLVSSGLMAADAVAALQSLRGESFFITSGEAKALNLVSPTGTGVDGFIGLANTSALYFPAAGGAIKSSQYDAVGVAAHELSEVMGRIGMEGASLGTHKDIYTPLDIFRYSAPHSPDVTPTAGYFSTNDGVTNLVAYNSPANGGDAADWASSTANRLNAYDAFDTPGVISQVTASDLLEVAALGFQVASGHILTTTNA